MAETVDSSSLTTTEKGPREAVCFRMEEDTVRAAGNVAVLEESAHLGGRSLVGHPTNLTEKISTR